jgi:hypothetical protein
LNDKVVNVEGWEALLAGKRNNLFWSAFVCLMISLSGLSVNVSADTVSENLRFSGDSTPVALEDVVLSSSAVVVGSATQLQVRFTTPDLEFPFDYRVGVTFPNAFGFDSQVSAVFSDDSPAPDPEIQLVEIVDHTVIFTFRRTFFAPKPGQVGIIDISGVTLPVASGGYSATVFISDIDYVVLAGPTFSSEVTLVPDVASSIAFSPSANVVVSAGQLVSFVGNSVDQYGNAVADSTLDWRLTADSDSLGVVTPGSLLATKTGSGRVVVSSSIAADTSGVITVVAGALARLEVDIDRQQYVGSGICGQGVVRAFDQFDNPKGNFSGTDTLLQLSVSNGYVARALIPVSEFDLVGVLDLAAYDVRFGGAFGDVEVTATLGAVVSLSSFITLDGIVFSFRNGPQSVTELPTSKRVSSSFGIRPTDFGSITIDSVVARLPDGATVLVVDSLLGFEPVRFPDFVTPDSPTGFPIDTLTVNAYGTASVNASSNETCVTIGSLQIPIRYRDDRIVLTPRVDSILSGVQYSSYRGFGFSNSFPLRRVLGGNLFFFDSTNELIKFGEYNFSLYSDVAADSASVRFSGRTPLLDSGLYGTKVTALLSDGFFEYEDTVSADSQLFIVEPGRLLASASELSPRAAVPGDSVNFFLPVTVDGSFSDSVRITVDLQLYTESDILEVSSRISTSNDTLYNPSPLFVPHTFAGVAWGVRYLLDVYEHNSWRRDTLDLGPDVFKVGPLLQINALSLTADAPNFPFVSAGQRVNLVARIVNDAPFEVTGVQVAVDTSVVIVGAVGAGDTLEVNIPYVAGDPASLQPVNALVTSADGARDESEAQIRLTVQRPALLRLQGNLNLQRGSEGQMIAEVGSALTLQLHIENDGEAAVVGGSALVTATGAGLDFSAIVGLDVPVTTTSLGIPSLPGVVKVTASALDKPQEVNTATDALFAAAGGAIFSESVTVVDRELVVNASITPGDTTAVAFGELREMFSVELSNVSALEEVDIEVVTLVALLRDADGERIDPTAVVDVSRSALFDSRGKAIAILRVSGDTLLMNVTPNTLGVGDKVSYRFVAQFAAKSVVRTFSLSVPVDGIELEVISGPREGARFVAEAPSGAPPFQSREYTLTSSRFVESFQPQNNPFNPDNGATLFSYTLSADNDIELAIYTLTGKLVRRFFYGSGSQYASTGVQTPSWDGRNGDGAPVRDGVYVVALTNLGTGETAFLKQAVLR